MKREELITFISKLTNLSSGDKARLYNSLKKWELNFYKNNPNIKKSTYSCKCTTGVFTGTYQFDIYQDENNKSYPPVVLMKNQKFRHILVQFGTGRLLFPKICSIEEWSNLTQTASSSIQYSVKQWLQKPLSKQFETLMKNNIYPVNLQMWQLYIGDNFEKYMRQVQRNKKQEQVIKGLKFNGM